MHPVVPAVRKVEVLVKECSGLHFKQLRGEIKIPSFRGDGKGLTMGTLYDNAEGFGRAGYSDYVVKWYGEPKDIEKELNEIR